MQNLNSTNIAAHYEHNTTVERSCQELTVDQSKSSQEKMQVNKYPLHIHIYSETSKFFMNVSLIWYEFNSKLITFCNLNIHP